MGSYKLYKVNLNNNIILRNSHDVMLNYNEAFVISLDSSTAYNIVYDNIMKLKNDEDYKRHIPNNISLNSIELLGDNNVPFLSQYPLYFNTGENYYENVLNLFLVELLLHEEHNMKYNYVIAQDPESAYHVVYNYMERNYDKFSGILKTISLIGSETAESVRTIPLYLEDSLKSV